MILRTEYDDIDPRRVIVDDLIDQGVLAPVEDDGVLWCFTHSRIPEDGIDLCGDEWRDIGECDFGKALIVRLKIGGDDGS